MSLLFCDGFDYYNTAAQAVLGKWTYQGFTTYVGTSYARPGGVGGADIGGSTSDSYLDAVIPNTQILIFGAAWKQLAQVSSGIVLAFMDTQSSYQCEVRLTSRNFTICRNGNLLATSTNVWTANVWYYLEFKAKIAAAPDGYVILRVNGVEWINSTGLNTKNTANPYANIARLVGPAYAAQYFDDVYLCDAAGSVNNDFLGDIKVKAFFPSGAGNYTTWTPNTGANYAAVDETAAPNDDTDYVATAVAANKDSYAYQDMPANAVAILAVVPFLYVRKDDAGTRHAQLLTRISSSDYLGTDVSLSNSYRYYWQIYETSPATSIAWTLSEFNATEFGINLIS